MNGLIADRMLEGLARKLRLLGYDCASVTGEYQSGGALLEQTRSEGRVLLTTARRLHEMDPCHAYLITAGERPEQLRAIVRTWPIDFAALAFTRCSRDNTPLEEVPFAVAVEQLPPLVREGRPDPVRRCPACWRLYREGSHVARTRLRFKEWLNIDLAV